LTTPNHDTDPNGTCKSLDINGPYSSFQVVGEDPECTVTIYAQDQTGDICSSTAPQLEVNIGRCYNASWVFYSIDGCEVPGSSATSSPTSSPSNSSSNSHSSVGPIVGGVVGGVVFVTMILVGAIYFWRKKKRSTAAPGLGEDARYELSGAEDRKEMPVSNAHGYFGGEMHGSKPPSVKGASPPPVELPANYHRSVAG
jgi:hypothetical protein